jgi:hypothetical protein
VLELRPPRPLAGGEGGRRGGASEADRGVAPVPLGPVQLQQVLRGAG